MEKIKIGISIGDINGIGLEVILKTLEDERILNLCTPVVYGSSKVVSYHKNITKTLGLDFNAIRTPDQILDGQVNVMNCWSENVNIKLGQLNDTGGKYAFRSLKEATRDLKEGNIDALVTAPINKKAMQMVGFAFPGHTEYLTQAFEVKESLMLMVNDTLRIGLVTNHLALRDVCAAITQERIVEKIQIMNDTLKRDFGIDKPKIAVLALNPHASDEGLMGDEEQNIITPALQQVKGEGILAIGPYPADGFFGSSMHKEYDGILAMYHDQGLVAFKTLSFGSGVNYTGGLPVVRTSPDHGTAYNIAGQNQANHSSFRHAMYLAIDVVRNRKAHGDMHSNALQRQDERALQQKLKEEEAKIREEEKKSRYNRNSKPRPPAKDRQTAQKPNAQQRAKDKPRSQSHKPNPRPKSTQEVKRTPPQVQKQNAQQHKDRPKPSVQETKQKPPRVQKSTTKPIEKSIEKSVTQPTVKPIEKSIEKPVTQPTVKPIEKSIEKSVTQPTVKPIEKSIEKPVAQPIVNKPTNQEEDKA